MLIFHFWFEQKKKEYYAKMSLRNNWSAITHWQSDDAFQAFLSFTIKNFIGIGIFFYSESKGKKVYQRNGLVKQLFYLGFYIYSSIIYFHYVHYHGILSYIMDCATLFIIFGNDFSFSAKSPCRFTWNMIDREIVSRQK